ncbi:MAG: hypothetical protein AAFR10_07275 [Pseudomonadota bacterium]
MRWLVAFFFIMPSLAVAQSRAVLPHELTLNVTVEDAGAVPFEREMVLITIRGIYRRHITLESLVQPGLDGFSWAQLGPDMWREERLDGKKVKVFERRMAVYPDRSGSLTIGAFRHQLTLTDEGDDWFEHEIASAPVTIEVAPAPAHNGWWFPTRSLQVSDQWSNAPDQLKPGEGVLRVVRLEALGVTPEMIPPMPELTSPSAMIFPHPEKRLVELTPEGPVTYAFWRWTIRPSNDTSTIVEPLTFSYFDTRNRDAREVTISAQRVAYGSVVPEDPPQVQVPEPANLPGPLAAALAAGVFIGGCAVGLWGRAFSGVPRLFDRFVWRLRIAGQIGDLRQTRRASSAMIGRDGATARRVELLRELDMAAFSPGADGFDTRAFVRSFLKAKTP